jgi:hypothetical protein
MIVTRWFPLGVALIMSAHEYPHTFVFEFVYDFAALTICRNR